MHGESLYCKVDNDKGKQKIKSEEKTFQNSGLPYEAWSQREPQDLHGHNRHQASGRKGFFSYIIVIFDSGEKLSLRRPFIISGKV